MRDGDDPGYDDPRTGLRALAWTVLVVGVLVNLAVAFLVVAPRVIAEVPRFQELTAWWPTLPAVPGPPLLLQLASGVPAVLAACFLIAERATRRRSRGPRVH